MTSSSSSEEEEEEEDIDGRLLGRGTRVTGCNPRCAAAAETSQWSRLRSRRETVDSYEDDEDDDDDDCWAWTYLFHRSS
jgi:hypothetical protein